VRDGLAAVGLGWLSPRLAEEAHWNRILSLGEQQRLALARALLHRPRYLFLDEATASLDEGAEAALYRLLLERFPGLTLVSIGHRSTLAAFHRPPLRAGARRRTPPLARRGRGDRLGRASPENAPGPEGPTVLLSRRQAGAKKRRRLPEGSTPPASRLTIRGGYYFSADRAVSTDS